MGVRRFDPDHNEKWGVGIPQGLTAAPQKWERNLNSGIGDGQKSGIDGDPLRG